MGSKLQDIDLTGFLTDGSRRIDIVLVILDEKYEEKIDKMKIDFLINIIKIGLEVEVETPVMKRHEKLMFIKVHAPDSIIEEYGKYFNIRKYFKASHNEFINPNKNLFLMKEEKDFIKTVRENYPGPLNYSNLERSTIVYHILLLLPFGQHENFIGLQRLMEKNIIIDAYALHDGPFFFRENQIPTIINARQVLFYHWVGKRHILDRQPVHLIREYLGEKVGIYFAYYEYFNISLLFGTLLGIFMFVEGLSYIKGNKVIKEACNEKNDSVSVCPLCRDFNICPFRNLTHYCTKVTITNFIDNSWTLINCILISLWAMLFVLLWRRRKNYLCWLWEYDQTDARIAVRSEFETNRSKIRKSKLTGIKTNTDTMQTRIGRLVITVLFLLICVFFVLPITFFLVIWKYDLSAKFDDLSTIWRDYLAVITITCVNVVIMTMLHKFSPILCYHLSRLENHKTFDSFETSFVTKLFGFGFVCNFTFLIYLFFPNALYTYPSDKDRWYLFSGIGILNCGPEGCLDELCVAFVVTVLVKEYLFSLPYVFLKTKSEYTVIENNVPIWEKEYLLQPFTENVLITKFNDLALKFALVGLFGILFPLTPLLYFLSGICKIRHEARQLVVGSRRPLLRQPSSQCVWFKIMLAVVYAVPFFSMAATTWMTTTLRYSDTYKLPSYFSFSMSTFYTEDYQKVTGPGSPAEAIENYKGFVPPECQFPGIRYKEVNNNNGEYTLSRWSWKVRYDKYRLMLEVEHLAILIMVILHCVVPAYSRDVTDTMLAEERIKRRKNITN